MGARVAKLVARAQGGAPFEERFGGWAESLARVNVYRQILAGSVGWL